jgi:hypothetical protein
MLDETELVHLISVFFKTPLFTKTTVKEENQIETQGQREQKTGR